MEEPVREEEGWRKRESCLIVSHYRDIVSKVGSLTGSAHNFEWFDLYSHHFSYGSVTFSSHSVYKVFLLVDNVLHNMPTSHSWEL